MSKSISTEIRAGHVGAVLLATGLLLAAVLPGLAYSAQAQRDESTSPGTDRRSSYGSQPTSSEYNRRLVELNANSSPAPSALAPADYRIGPEDQIEINVLEAPELNHELRVSTGGEISLALIGTVHAEGLTPQGLELVLEELLRRTYIKNPHVSVQVREMQSHPVAVFGAVKKPGVFQIRQPKTVIELLSMAEGLDVDAGDSVIIEHRGEDALLVETGSEDRGTATGGTTASESSSGSSGGSSNGPSNATEIGLKKLLETGDPALNVLVYPGDVVKVPRAGLIYVVGEVKKPGGYELKSNENISVLQAVALAEGLTLTSASSYARIIRTDGTTGKRQEIPIDLNKILAGKRADPMLEPRDIVFVPNSAARNALYRGLDAAISIGTGVAIYGR